MLRTGRDGDLFGARRGGLSIGKLRAHPHGIVLAPHVETGVLKRRVRHRGGKVHLDSPQVRAELARLGATAPDDEQYPLRLIGQREIRSHNSWTHNLPKFGIGGRRQRALLHPKDAASAGVLDGDALRVVSAHGAIQVPVELSEDVAPGTIVVPHGWGHHDAGWTVANAAGGANVNELMSDRPADLEQVSGRSHLNAVPVRIEAAAALRS